MACLYKRKRSGRYWIAYYVNGRLIQKSLGTAAARRLRDSETAVRNVLILLRLQHATESQSHHPLRLGDACPLARSEVKTTSGFSARRGTGKSRHPAS